MSSDLYNLPCILVSCTLSLCVSSDLGAALTGGETEELMAVIEEEEVPAR